MVKAGGRDAGITVHDKSGPRAEIGINEKFVWVWLADSIGKYAWKQYVDR
jgi:hypothetical protein